MPPPAGVKSPALWGTRSRLDELFGPGAADIAVKDRQFVFRYHSADHWMEIFRTFYGPVHKAFGALDETKQESLERDIRDLLGRFNVAEDGTLVVPSDYIEVVITRR
jgi:hypothetical protein